MHMCVYSLHIYVCMCLRTYPELKQEILKSLGPVKLPERSLEKLYLSFSNMMLFSSKVAMLFNRTLFLSQMN